MDLERKMEYDFFGIKSINITRGGLFLLILINEKKSIKCAQTKKFE